MIKHDHSPSPPPQNILYIFLGIKMRPDMWFPRHKMAFPTGCLTTLDDPEYVETWIICFEARARVKKLKDWRSEGEQNEITDMFLATDGCEAIQKVSTMAYPRNLEELTFKKINEVIKRNIRSKISFWKQNSTPMSLMYISYTDWKKELDIANLKDLAQVKWPQKRIRSCYAW